MLLELCNIEKTYMLGEVEVPALKGINLQIDKGEFISVCGASGSGKTTMLNIIGTIDKPSAGRVIYEGENILEFNDDRRTLMRNTTVGFVFQTFNLIPVLSALENVMLPLMFRKMTASEARERAEDKLKAVGLQDYMEHWPDKLSGGQRQRVAIARALAQGPKLVIADEPTANLDSKVSMQIIEIMHKLNQEENITFLFSTHDPRLIKEVKRVVWLEDGVIRKEGGPSHL